MRDLRLTSIIEEDVEGLVSGQEVLGEAADAIKVCHVETQRNYPLISQKIIDCLCCAARIHTDSD